MVKKKKRKIRFKEKIEGKKGEEACRALRSRSLKLELEARGVDEPKQSSRYLVATSLGHGKRDKGGESGKKRGRKKAELAKGAKPRALGPLFFPPPIPSLSPLLRSAV